MSARIIVHSLEHTAAAAAASAALGLPVILQSAPGAGTYAGPTWFMAVVEAATAAYPGAQVTTIIDCADEAGSVLAALRTGFRRVRFTGRPDTRARLADIAAALGAEIEGDALVEALDLLDRRDAEAACRAWLAAPGTAP